MVPQNALYFLTLLSSSAHLQLFDTDKILDKILPVISQGEATSTKAFSSLGIKSPNVIRNLGIFLLVLAGGIVVVTLVGILGLLQKKHKMQHLSLIEYSLSKLYVIIHQKLFFNSIIRTGISSYLKIAISVWIACQLSSTIGSSSYSQYPVLFLELIFVCGFPFFSLAFLFKNSSQLGTEKYQKRFSSFFMAINYEKDLCILQNFLFLMRRLVMSLTVVYLQEYASFQLFMSVLTSLAYLGFLIKVRPYSIGLLNNVEIFNEIGILFCFYSGLLFSDYLSDFEMRYKQGWFFSAVLFGQIAINVLGILYTAGKSVIQMINKKCKRLKKKREVVAAPENAVIQETVNNSFILTQTQQHTLCNDLSLEATMQVSKKNIWSYSRK